MTAQRLSKPARSRQLVGRLAKQTNHEVPATSTAPGTSLLAILLLLFVGSGCAALIYEIVWFQLLELSVGSSAISIAVLLATFMGGMSIGSLGLARFVPLDRHPLRVYASIELGIGACGLLVLWLLPYAGGLYLAIGGHGFGGLLLRGLLSALCLLPPTILMGATLPAVSRWVETTARGVAWLGFLYGGNTLGSVAGCLLAGFYLLRVHDMFVATYAAVAINVVVGGGALWLAWTGDHAPARAKKAAAHKPSEAIWPVLLAIGLSGFTALGSEVVWTRLLSLMLGATVYTYSLILAAILLGLAVGSYIGSSLLRTSVGPRTLLGWCQVLLTVGIAWSAYQLTAVLPFQPNEAALSSSLAVAFRHDVLRSVWAVTPAALLWGASFPLALAAAAPSGRDPGRSVGFVYAANTLGAILGALVTSLLAMAWLGSQRVQQALIFVAAFSAVVVLLPAVAGAKRRAGVSAGAAGVVAVPLVLAVALAATVHPVPGALVGYGPGSADSTDARFIYIGEGMNSSVAVSLDKGVLYYHNAGKVQASSEPQDLRLERMLGHLTTLQPERPASVLVIGCGAGVTAGAVSIDPRVEKLTVVEIEPLVPEAAQKYFARFNEGVVNKPKTSVVIDDGRHYLLTSRRKYDAITCDPFDPWTKGAATLSTTEFFQSVKSHLNPGGVVTVWVPLYQTRLETVQSEIATFMSVFPNGVAWGNIANGMGYDIVLSGRADDTPIDVDAVEARVMRPEYAPVRESLSSVGFGSADDLFATFSGYGPELRQWLAGAQINRDRNLRLQYLAGVGLGNTDSDAIYQDMVAHRSWPEGLFKGSQRRLDALRRKIGL
ncbi:MAG TPA: fused MFS/spermidine synthase [Coriobacteriia bacterium]